MNRQRIELYCWEEEKKRQRDDDGSGDNGSRGSSTREGPDPGLSGYWRHMFQCGRERRFALVARFNCWLQT